ncbi:MAG: NTP transferase domain-containing protein [Verrucomicrobia bacterium]|nr:NTP transferase domain-containing protein [Verrucomicrobiota bacterium]
MMLTAFVLGAGLGTRLRPLTDTLPKPLVPIFGKPLITFALDHLRGIGVESFVINTHHLARRLDDFFAAGNYLGSPVRLIHEPVLLETGGGMKNAEALIGAEPFIVYSGDILTDFDLQPLLDAHFRAGNDVTLALRATQLAAGVAMRDDGRIVSISKTNAAGNYDFANVSVWNPEIFARIPAATKISFIPVVLEWLRAGGKIGGVVLADGRWFNIGSRNEYLAVHRELLDAGTGDAPAFPRYGASTAVGWRERVDPAAQVHPSARLRGCSFVGAGATVGADAVLADTLVWPGAEVRAGSRLKNCIVRSGQVASGAATERDF